MALRPLGFDDFDHMEIDEETGQLFWHGRAIVTNNKLRLETYQIWLATLATAGTVASGLYPFGQSFGWWP